MAAALHFNAKPFNFCSPSISLSKPSPTLFRLRCSAGTSPSRRYNIALLPGDGIGPEVIAVAKDVLNLAASFEGPSNPSLFIPLFFLVGTLPVFREEKNLGPFFWFGLYMVVVGFMFCWRNSLVRLYISFWFLTRLDSVSLGIGIDYKEMPVGGAALDLTGVPLPDETLLAAKQSDAVLFGAIGGYLYL